MDELVRAADGALYRAKDAGKDCVVQFASEVPGRT
jgi:PleD family two-component response regulator